MFDTPVLIINFNRPDKTEKILNILRLVKPRKLYLSIDGPRKKNIKDKIQIKKIKKKFQSINWNCEIKKKYSNKNNGMKTNVINSVSWFFKNEKMGIILEDDCIPSKSFFIFCKILLKKYQNQKNIFQINGHSINFPQKKESYYFSKLNSTWGWATWRRAWKKLDIKMLNYQKMKKNSLISKYYKNKNIYNWMNTYFQKTLENKDNIWSIYWSFTILKNNGLCISPFKNLITNIGFDGSGTTKRYTSFKATEKIKSYNSLKLIHPKKINYLPENDQFFFDKYVKKVDKRAKKNVFYELKNFLYKIKFFLLK